MEKILGLALAGAAGTLARYGLAGLVHRFVPASFPWGTMTVNVVGCFLAGMAWSLFEHRWAAAGEARIIILVGFMGGFTTFSAFMLETGNLARSAEWSAVAANLLASNTLGFAALLAGLALGKWI